MRSIRLCFFLAGAVSAATPGSIQAGPPKSPLKAPVAPAAAGCKSITDCACPAGHGRMCLKGQCGCGEPFIIDGKKAATPNP